MKAKAYQYIAILKARINTAKFTETDSAPFWTKFCLGP